MSRKVLDEAYRYMYRLLYEKATPSADWDTMDKSDPHFFYNYELESEKFEEVIKETLKKFKLYKHEKTSLRFIAYMGPSPKTKGDNVH